MPFTRAPRCAHGRVRAQRGSGVDRNPARGPHTCRWLSKQRSDGYRPCCEAAQKSVESIGACQHGLLACCCPATTTCDSLEDQRPVGDSDGIVTVVSLVGKIPGLELGGRERLRQKPI